MKDGLWNERVPRVIIVTKGGKILSVRGTTPDINVRVCDWDNLDSDDADVRKSAEEIDREYQEMIHPLW